MSITAEDFKSMEFDSWTQFASTLDTLQKSSFSMFRIRHSESVEKSNRKRKNLIPLRFEKAAATFVCTHFGHPIPRGTGKMKDIKYSATGCEAQFSIRYFTALDKLKVSLDKPVILEHKGHETTPISFQQEYRNKRLTKEQQEDLKDVVDATGLGNDSLISYIQQKWGKTLDKRDIRHVKSKLKQIGLSNDIKEVWRKLDTLERLGQVKVTQSIGSNGEYIPDIVAFSTNDQIQSFKRSPRLIYVDGSYKMHRSGYLLYQILVEGAASQVSQASQVKVVFYAFVRQTNPILERMAEMFSQIMGEDCKKIKFIMSDEDKDYGGVEAFKKILPESKNVFCNFHVLKTMKSNMKQFDISDDEKSFVEDLLAKIVNDENEADFREHVNLLKRTAPDYYYVYFDHVWMTCVSNWALHCLLPGVSPLLQPGSSYLLCSSENKCAPEHETLKMLLGKYSSLGSAVLKIFQHSCISKKLDVDIASELSEIGVDLHPATVVIQDGCSESLVKVEPAADDSSGMMVEIVGAEQQDVRAQLATERLRKCLKYCNDQEFVERIEALEKIAELWEDGSEACIQVDDTVETDNIDVSEQIAHNTDVSQHVAHNTGTDVSEHVPVSVTHTGSVQANNIVAFADEHTNEICLNIENQLKKKNIVFKINLV